MKVGVLFARMPQEIGGGHSFTSGLLQEMRTIHCNHQFTVFCRDSAHHDPGSDVPTIDLASQYPDFNSKNGSQIAIAIRRIRSRARPSTSSTGSNSESTLMRALRDFEIDLAWNLGLADFGEIQIPLMLNVWDLQHRLQPYFPEVSFTGWNWKSREDFYQKYIKRSALILTGTNVGKDEIIHFYGVNPKNVFVIPLPVPPLVETDFSSNLILRKYGLDPGYLLYPAQFWPHKNHINALYALRKLRDERDIDIDIVFTGSDTGNRTFVIEATERLGLKDGVYFLGFVPRSDLMVLYKEAFALLFPTFFGPDNLPPLEAFALDCPVLASDVPGAAEQLSDAAILFDPSDPGSISKSIDRLCHDEALRANLIEKGRRLIKNRSQKDYLESVCNILDNFEYIRRCWGREYTHA